MKTTKQLVVAGVAALALLAMPGGPSVRASGSELALRVESAVSTAYAASNTEQPITAPTTGAATGNGNRTVIRGTFTTPGTGTMPNGSTARMQGFQTRPGKGRVSDGDCQRFADAIQDQQDQATAATLSGDEEGADKALGMKDAMESFGLDQGCAFIY
jgi:hypothetical protein